ncbi:MAG: hypothetical protein F6K57_14255 [Moorea sp. SIO4A5]|nr:hypothetical protein [Moorena sp. SIO4A5]
MQSIMGEPPQVGAALLLPTPYSLLPTPYSLLPKSDHQTDALERTI